MTFSVATPVTDSPWPTALQCAPQTWAEAPATAEVTIAGAVDPSTTPAGYQDQPPFTVPTPPEE